MRARLLHSIFWAGGLLAAIVALTWYAGTVLFAPESSRAHRLALAFDQLGNAATGGSEDETISSRAGRARRDGRRWAIILCRILDWLDPGHCERSIGT